MSAYEISLRITTDKLPKLKAEIESLDFVVNGSFEHGYPELKAGRDPKYLVKIEVIDPSEDKAKTIQSLIVEAGGIKPVMYTGHGIYRLSS
ncbi:hypothetical protein [Vreelandella aquamarina]|uniref:Uncharacterized protein n=1 Tax=Vreelandella aquamarina TaxID=77097 RepID=A0A6F8SW26_9GAMM|nr:hypothetical protein [Halomonas meridiana]BCA91906.1 hypothetical protein HMSLTHF_16810 [Halomonas meridiana]